MKCDKELEREWGHWDLQLTWDQTPMADWWPGWPAAVPPALSLPQAGDMVKVKVSDPRPWSRLLWTSLLLLGELDLWINWKAATRNDSFPFKAKITKPLPENQYAFLWCLIASLPSVFTGFYSLVLDFLGSKFLESFCRCWNIKCWFIARDIYFLHQIFEQTMIGKQIGPLRLRPRPRLSPSLGPVWGIFIFATSNTSSSIYFILYFRACLSLHFLPASWPPSLFHI